MSKQYVKKVVDYLESMAAGAILDVSKSPTRENFIQVAKWYIDSFGGMEFNSTYTKLRKCKN